MRTVNISDLKARLSAYRHLDDHPGQERRLVALGILRPPLKKRPVSASWPEPPGNVSDEVMKQVWREEREGR